MKVIASLYALILALSAFPLSGQGFDPSKAVEIPTTVLSGNELEHVDLMSGALSVKIPLVHLKGRGLDMDIYASYSSKVWQSQYIPSDSQTILIEYFGGAGTQLNGWNIGVPELLAGGSGSITCFDPSTCVGATVFLGQLVRNDGSTMSVTSATASNSAPIYSYDGSYMKSSSDQTTFYLKDGKRLLESGSKLEDTNGNYIQCSYTACTDSLGRMVTFTRVGNTPYLQSLSYKDSSGNSQTITFTYNSTANISYPSAKNWIPCNTPGNQTGQCIINGESLNANGDSGMLLTEISLSKGGKYTFEYLDNGDGTTSGELSKLTYPTGGYVRYTYTDFDPQYSDVIASNRRVQDKYVSPDGTTASEQHWSYSANNFEGYTDPLGNRHIEQWNSDIGGPNPYNGQTFPPVQSIPTPALTEDIDQGGVVLKKVTKAYQCDNSSYSVPNTPPNISANNPRIVSETTVMNGSSNQSVISYGYSNYGNVNSESYRDWVSSGTQGILLKTISRTFLADQNSAYAADNVHILNRPLTETTSGNCGSSTGNCSTTSYVYDAYSSGRLHLGLQSTSGIAQHDYQNYPASNLTRGNVTQIIHGNGLNGGSTTSDSAYDDLGNVIIKMDGAGNQANYDYADNYYGAQSSNATKGYLTKITKPSTNGSAHVEQYQYYLNSGMIAAHCGESFTGACTAGLTSPQSDYAWLSYDEIDRVTNEYLGDGEHSSILYNDDPLNTSIKETTTMNATQSIIKIVSYDGLGRESRLETASDPQGTSYSDITYDAAGRRKYIYNIYRSASDSTYGATTLTYDGLGRQISSKAPGGATVTWAYVGNTVLKTDEANNQWKQSMDALGRLTQVLEPNGIATSPSMETDYAYDALNNLTKVTQMGSSGSTPRMRSFNYDSLSRLLCASNPENSTASCPTTASSTYTAGTVGYTYDGNGNVHTKTDARGVITTYTYDALNRATQKQYSDGEPTVAFGYDGKDNGNHTLSSANSIGRMSYATNGNGTTSTYSYDLMGRLAKQLYCLPNVPNNCTGTSLSVSALYDLAGNLTSLTYPDGRVVQQSYDTANRLSAVQYQSWNGTNVGTQYLSVSAYDPAGHPTAETIGSGTTMSAGYNSRLEMASLNYKAGSSALWGRQLAWTPNGNLQSAGDTVAQTTRQYSYDTLNRLISAQDIVGVSSATGQPDTGGTSTSSGDLVSDPEALGTGGWSGLNASMTPNITAPDGSLTAVKVTSTSGTDSYVQGAVTHPGLYDGMTVNASVWLEAPSGAMPMSLSVVGTTASGPVTITSTSASVTTNWQLFQMSVTLPNGLQTLAIQIGGSGTLASGQSLNMWSPNLSMVLPGGSVTNLLPYSQQIGNAPWSAYCAANISTNMTLNTTAVPAPDGTNTATMFVVPSSLACGSAGSWGALASIPSGLTVGQTYTASVWLRGAAGGETVDFGLNDCAWNNVTLSTSWQRFTYSILVSSAIANCGTGTRGFQVADNTVPNQTYYVWGAQVEDAPTVGEYVSTLAQPETEAIDTNNAFPNSQQAGGSGWSITQGTFAANTTTAPDGTTTADTASSTGSNTYIRINASNPALYENAPNVTASIYLAVPSGSRTVTLNLLQQGGTNGSITSQTVTVTSTWQRFDLTGPTGNGLTAIFLNIGGGTQITAGNPLYLWGAQMVVGAVPGEYDPTTGTVTEPGGTTVTLLQNGLNETYGYDAFGNMTSSGNFTFSQSYSPANRLNGWSYDASGDLLSDGLGNTYTYDAEGRAATAAGYTYVYDGTGTRVAKTGGTPVGYIDFGGREIARYSNGQWTDLIYGAGSLLAEVPGTQTATPIYRLTDHLGSSVGTVSSTGALLEVQDYAPFGQLFNGNSSDPYKFTGKERDAESGNDYFGARYYASSMGRWLSPDWSAQASPVPYAKLDNPQSLNLYAYVGNNPVLAIDSDGHDCVGCLPHNGLEGRDWVSTTWSPGRSYGASDFRAPEGQEGSAQQQTPTAAPAPTTQYKNLDAAGIAAEQKYNPASKDLNREFNGNIYQNSDGKCCFVQTPNIGTVSTSSPPDVSTLPSGAARVGTFHTHGADSHGAYDDEHFSPADMTNAGRRGVPIFVGTPGGVIRKFDPATQKITTFKETAP